RSPRPRPPGCAEGFALDAPRRCPNWTARAVHPLAHLLAVTSRVVATARTGTREWTFHDFRSSVGTAARTLVRVPTGADAEEHADRHRAPDQASAVRPRPRAGAVAPPDDVRAGRPLLPRSARRETPRARD